MEIIENKKFHFTFLDFLFLGSVVILSFSNVLRALIFDSVLIVPASVSIIFLLGLIAALSYKKIHLKPSLIFCYLLLILLMIIYISGYQGNNLFADLFLYYFTPFIGFSFYFFLNTYSLNKIKNILIFFVFLIFIPETIYIFIEILDGFIGYDIHKLRLTKWYFDNDPGRFEHMYLGGGNNRISPFELLPPAIGLRGWPHYTAPLYTMSLAFIIALSYEKNNNQFFYHKFRRSIFFLGVTCVFLLGVKTHFITIIISIFLIAIYLNRRLFIDFIIFSFCGVLAIIYTEAGRSRVANYYEQLFIGGWSYEQFDRGDEAHWESGRLEVIFNFKEYLVFLDISMIEIISGLSRFSALKDLGNLVFEQKILVIAVVFGIPYITIILYLCSLGLRSSYNSFKILNDKELKSVAMGIFCALLILILEMGHFGFTFNYPQYHILFMLIVCGIILEKKILSKNNINLLS